MAGIWGPGVWGGEEGGGRGVALPASSKCSSTELLAPERDSGSNKATGIAVFLGTKITGHLTEHLTSWTPAC